MSMEQLQQIGLRHPVAELVRDIQNNRTGIPRRTFVAEGLFENNIVLQAGVRIEAFLWCPEAAYSDEAAVRGAELAKRAGRAYQISAKTLQRLAERPNPDGLISIAVLPDWEPETVPLATDALVLVMDGVEIPGNVGTLIRTLDACAADCLVLTSRRTRLTHPKVLRSSQGTSVKVPAVEFGEVADAVLSIDFYYEEGPKGAFVPVVRDVEMLRVTSARSAYAIYARGLDRSTIDDIRLVDCTFMNVKNPSVVERVTNLELRNTRINGVLVKA